MNPYEVLGISPDSTEAEIRSAYIRMCARHHPDRPNGNTKKFIEATEAYNKLKQKRNGFSELDIKNFEQTYRDSDEEIQEIKELYIKFKGKICKIIDSMLIGRNEDEPRIRNYVAGFIANGEVETYENFKKTVADNKSRLKRLSKEAEMVEHIRSSFFDKPLLNPSWEDTVENLVEKYCGDLPKKETPKKRKSVTKKKSY